jgi:hypothetical protein
MKLKNPKRPHCLQDCPHILSAGGADFCDFVCPDSKAEPKVKAMSTEPRSLSDRM